jgi:CRISPR-associated endonuclease/helicase Cas3
MAFNEQSYRDLFGTLTGREPYDHQVAVARALMQGGNVNLRAPTGSGKTLAALVAFLYGRRTHRWRRLIYTLPLRTLAQGIYAEARELARVAAGAAAGAAGKLDRPLTVSIQTGERPEDETFESDIVITTYDQLLSGLLASAYGLSRGRRTVNAAAAAGALVVFDEYHLMDADKAFLTGAALMRLFGTVTQSIWMTATATSSLAQVLSDALAAVSVPSLDRDLDAEFGTLPSVRGVRRELRLEAEPLSADAVVRQHIRRSIAIANTVARAQELAAGIRKLRPDLPVIVLHARFFKGDREDKQEKITAVFGPKGRGEAVLVATQVVEAGLDISCERLHTEICPVNSLAQRAGRCARYAGESGIVCVYPLPPEANANPYESGDLDSAQRVLEQAVAGAACGDAHPVLVTPAAISAWVEVVHARRDARAVAEGVSPRLNVCLQHLRASLEGRAEPPAKLIRVVDSVRCLIAESPPNSPSDLEGLGMSIGMLKGFVAAAQRNAGSCGDSPSPPGWYYTGDEDAPWQPLTSPADVTRALVVCLHPAQAAYDSEIGLRLGEPGSITSPARPPRPPTGYASSPREPWATHALGVTRHMEARLDEDVAGTSILAVGLKRTLNLDPDAIRAGARVVGLCHDFGKLQRRWQAWAGAGIATGDRPVAHTGRRDEPGAPRISRPPHSACGAYYAQGVAEGLLMKAGDDSTSAGLMSTVAVAILSHHGGWLSDSPSFGFERLIPIAAILKELSVAGITADRPLIEELQAASDRGHALQYLSNALTHSIHDQAISLWWPLVAYYIRCLRLSDQSALKEGGE